MNGARGTAPPARPAWLAVCGHANVDVVLRLAHLPRPGASEPVRERRVVWGGTAANVARHAAGLGVPTRLWARVGTDFDPAWRAALSADGVELAFLDVDPERRTPTCYVLTDAAGEQAFCLDQGAMAAMAQHPPSPALLDGASWLHVATGEPAAYMAVAAEAQARGVRVGFDPGQELRFQYDARSFERLAELSDVLFLNRHEVEVALRMMNYGDPVQLLDHVPAIVATRGAEGATLLRRRHKPFHLPAPPARLVDPTGAGDALRAGWYAALHAGHDEETALAWGQAAAAQVVGMHGPQERALRRDDLGVPA